jgi:hypothetical protein
MVGGLLWLVFERMRVTLRQCSAGCGDEVEIGFSEIYENPFERYSVVSAGASTLVPITFQQQGE